MDLKIISVNGQGDARHEHVYIAVLNDCSLQYYAIADTTYVNNDSVSNELRHFYWFPTMTVRAGEFVSLRTGVGQDTTYETNDGTKIHRLYWNLGSAVWNDRGDAAVLFKMETWEFTRARPK